MPKARPPYIRTSEALTILVLYIISIVLTRVWVYTDLSEMDACTYKDPRRLE